MIFLQFRCYLADHVEEALVALKAEKALLPAHELAVGCEE